MSRAGDLNKVCETILSDIGDRFETTVRVLRDAGFMMASFSKGDAFTAPSITLDNGTVITIDKDTLDYDVSMDSRYAGQLHKKQRFFTPGDLLQALAQIPK